jgi:hypothetical protein
LYVAALHGTAFMLATNATRKASVDPPALGAGYITIHLILFLWVLGWARNATQPSNDRTLPIEQWE